MKNVNKEVLRNLGDFDYELHEQEGEASLETKGPLELDEKGIYIGQWSKDALRHGKGK